MEEAGESTEGMAESTASLRQEMLALSGVDIMLNNNTFKSTYQIMDELSEKWENLSDIAQATIIELVAGKHQGNVFASLMANFDIAREALDTSLNSSGSAMKEHAKWSESLEARLNKLKATWQSLSQSFMSSDFLKIAIDGIITFIDVIDKLIQTIGTLPTLLGGFAIFKSIGSILSVSGVGGIKSLSDILAALSLAFPKAATGVKIFTSALAGSTGMTGLAKAATIGKGAISGLWAVIASHPILATVAAIGIGIVAFNKWNESAEELSERIEEVTTKYKDQHGSLMKMKGDFDTSNEDSLISKYGELSKGVGEFGENLSLTADEYAEYQNIVNTIADQLPSLVSGYNSQGDAILSCAGNVEELTNKYKELIKEQNSEVLKNGSDIFKDFKNDLKDTSAYYKELVQGENGSYHKVKFDTKHFNVLENLMNPESLGSDDLESAIEKLSNEEVNRISGLLDEYGIKRNVFFDDEYGFETQKEHIIKALSENKTEIKKVLDEAKTDLNKYAEDLGTVTESYFSTAFLGGNGSDIGDYSHLSERMQNIINQVASSFDSEFYADFLNKENPYEELTKYFDSMLGAFDKLNASEKKQFEASFDLETKFNSGEISYGEYVNGIQNAENLINGLDGLDEDVKNQIKLALNTEEVAKDYDALKKRLISDEYNIQMNSDEAEEFLDSLTASEYSVAIDLIANGEIDFSKFNIDSFRKYIEEQAKLQEAMNFTIAMDIETESIEALNTAMAESVSGAGLSSEAITALKGRYAELESQGYNLSAMFEETANGIHLNKKAVGELEQKLASDKLAETDKQLGVLKNRYDELTTEIDNCKDAGDRAALYTEQQSIVDKINDLATLASQYEGLTSAYNAWQNAESAGQERDMYENMLEGFETVKDEISRGWIDDGTTQFLKLLYGDKTTITKIVDGKKVKEEIDIATASASDLKQAYKELDNNIKHTTYSVKDFFTVDEDGNSTSKGVYNFLDAIGQMEEEKFGGKDVVKRDKNGKVIGFDFEIVAKKDKKGNVIKNGDQVVAEALGISEELVQIMLRAADDAGFVVNLEGAYTQLADLKTEAESARDTLISLQKNGLEKLKGVDVNFDLNADGNDLVAEQGKAVELLDKFKKDGKIDLKMEGAQQALDIAEYLTIRLDDLTEPKFMQIDTSEVEEDLRNPIEKIQEIGDLCKEKHLVTLTGDTKEIDEVQGKINKVAKEIEELDPEVKAQIGIDDNWDSKTIADKIEKGEIEIPAELELDVQMSDDLKDMRLMMMNQLGLASDNEVKLKVGFDIDESLVDTLDDKKQTVVLEYITKNEKEFNKLTEEEKEVVVKLIADGVDLENYEVEDKEAIVNYIANGEEADGWTPEAKDAFVKYLADGGEIDKFDPKNKESWVVYDTDTTKPDGYEPDDEDATVIFGKDTSDPDGYDPNDPKATVIFDKDTSAVDSWKPVVTGIAKFTLSMIIPQGVRNALAAVGISVANGTANVNGTAFADGSATELSGKAFKQGSWGTKDSGTALMGEVGRETIVRDGKFFTVGDFGAGFYQYKKGDIIFNHKQTEELFKYGKVTSGGGRGKALVNGTAFSSGTGGGIAPEVKSYTVGSKSKKSKSSSSSSSKDDFEETLDFVEIAISRIERAIDLLDKKANNIYKSWSSRNKALTSEINKVKDEIELQQSAYNRYIKEANSVGLSGSWAKKVRDGKIDISTIKDEKLAEKIKNYQNWFEKSLACKDAIEELKETESSLYAQRLENVSTQYEGILGVIEHEKNMLEEYISKSEAQGWLVSGKYYEALASNEKDNIAQLKKEKVAMLSDLQTAMNSGTIAKNSEAYYDMIASIDEVTLAIAESETALKEYAQTIQELDFEVFDILQDRISAVAEEAEFLIELMSSDKLFDDNGQLTNSGKATLGLHGQNYNTYMYQSDKYATEIADLDKEIVKDPYDQELIDRRQELLELQQEAILNAQKEKEAIRDLVSDGIDVQLDALQKLIDKKDKALESERDLYEYQKKVKEQTEEIAALEKQLSAYSGDDSEEARQKIQQIKVGLETARQNLGETETDRLIENTASLLDNLYLEAEGLLNMRLDNLDALVSDVITEINTDSTVIGDTIRETADSVGYTLSDSMTSIWDTNSTKINDAITVYGEKFSNAQTTTNNALNTINTNLQNVIAQLNSIAKTNVKSASNSSASKPKQASEKKEEPKKNTPKKDTSKSSTIKVGGKINAGSAKIYDYAGDKSGERQLYRNDPIYKVLKTDGSWLQVRWHKLSKGVTGWFKKGDVKAYATGKKNFSSDETAWTQDGGKEFIIRPSDGAILTPIAKGDSVLNSVASNNIWDMANSPAEFIKDNLNFGSTNVPNNSNIQSSCVQNFDKVVFNMPNVKNYGELLSEMQRDPKFEKLILAMTFDQVAGKSKLGKGKSIR